MYEIFQKLLEERGAKPADITRATGISSSTFTDWKNGRSKPKSDKLQLIADYFSVSLDYLMNGEEPEFDRYDDEITHLYAKIRNDADLSKALMKYFELSESKKKHVVELINLLSMEG